MLIILINAPINPPTCLYVSGRVMLYLRVRKYTFRNKCDVSKLNITLTSKIYRTSSLD